MARAKGRRTLALAAAAAALLAAGAFSVPFLIGWWLDFSDEPFAADALVVLNGDEVSRAIYGAELFNRGLAPQLWLASPKVRESVRQARGLGIPVLTEDEVFREIFLRLKVPKDRIRRYGDGIISTTGEARTLRQALDPAARRVLVVTSRYHARRAKVIFRRALPGVEVRVAATPYESFSRAWWRDQTHARAAILEAAKTVFFIVGGAFE